MVLRSQRGDRREAGTVSHPLVTVAALLALVLALVVVRRGRGRLNFAATVRRHHPELAHQVDGGLVELGRVAARAVDVGTPAAPRTLADLEVV